MASLIHPTYFPTVAHFTAIAKDEIVLEGEDNFQKQTYRNRTYIYSPNGRQMLSVPIHHSKNDIHRKYKDIRVDDSFNWQKQHWKSIQTAYRTSPFFEFYEDEIAPIFEKKHEFLFDLNIKTLELICECLQLPAEFDHTKVYNKVPVEGLTDLRWLVDAKISKPYNFTPYVQVFGEKHGFLENLSILDLLFNNGPDSINYLESQAL